MNLMKKRLFFGFKFVLIFALFLSNSHGTYIPQTVLEGHTNSVNSVSFSPDGSMLASGSSDKRIRLWNAATGVLLHTLTGHEGGVKSVTFSPDGSMLVSGGDDNTIRLWDVATRKELKTLEGHTTSVRSVAFSPDGSMLASGSDDNTIRLWDVATGEEPKILRGEWWNDRIESVAFSPDGSMLVSGGADNTIRLWDVATGKELMTLTGHRSLVYSVAFSPDGSMLASGSADNTIRLWDVSTGKGLNTLELSSIWQGYSVYSVTFSPDGSMLASGSDDNTIRLWELPSTHVSITPSPVESPAVGEQLVINVSIKGGKNVRGYAVNVGYNPFTLRYVSHTRGDYLPGNVFPGPEILPPDEMFNRNDAFVIFTMVSPDGVKSGDGTLATITFEVVARRASTLELYVALSDSDGERLGHWSKDGSVIEPPWDVNGDGFVNLLDLSIVASRFGEGGDNRADVNRDGVVNITDLILVASGMYGELAAPAAHLQTEPTLAPAAVKGWLAQAQGLDLTDARLHRGVAFLEQLLAVLTPKETQLLANYPNPFNPETWIPYTLSEYSDISIRIYDSKGQAIRQLSLGMKPAGVYIDKDSAAYWDGTTETGEKVSSGIYFYSLSTGSAMYTKKMIVVK